jgi:PAS domain S-box-containing protein
MPARLSSTKQRIIAITMATTITGLLLTFLAFFAYEAVAYHRTLVMRLESLAKIVGANCSAALIFDDKDAAQEILSALTEEKNITDAALYNADGQIFAVYHNPHADKTYAVPAQKPALGYLSSPGCVMIVRVIKQKDEPIGMVFVASDTNELYSRLKEYSFVAFWVLFVALGAAAILALRLHRVISTPISRMTSAARQIADDNDYSIRVPGEDRKDELGILVHAFNAMVQRVKERESALAKARDELEIKVAERTADLRLEKDRNRLYLDVAAVMMIALDKTGKVTLFNQKGTQVTGYGEAEILGKDWFDLMVPKESIEVAKATFKKILAGETESVKRSESPIVIKDKSIRLIGWWNSVLRDENGNIVGALSSGEDITEKRRLADELHRAQKLESIGTFAGGIAHDFNNFLMAILGTVQLAKESLDQEEELLDLLHEAETAVSRATDLTRQLITFAKGENPIMKPISIVGVVRTASNFALTGSNTKCQFESPPDLWLIDADMGQIEQVVTNLVVNAKQAMPEGGIVSVSLSNIDPELAAHIGLPLCRHVDLCVQDSGVGIPPKILPKIFDPYFTTKQTGSGLGLATTYSIIKKHNGQIFVDSTPGKGTTFHIYLPALPENVNIPSESSQIKHKLKKDIRILVMDDDASVGKVITLMLKKLKCHVTLAKDGEKAIQFYKEAQVSGNPFDVVILDVIVPGGMGGKETARRLKALYPSVKLLASTGYSDDHLMANFREFGFDALLVKPYDQSALVNTLQDVLEEI